MAKPTTASKRNRPAPEPDGEPTAPKAKTSGAPGAAAGVPRFLQASGPGLAPTEQGDQERSWAERPASQPDAAGSTVLAQSSFEGLALTPDRPQLRATLEQYVASHGLTAAEAYVGRYVAEVESGADTYSREAYSSEADLLGLDEAIAPLLEEEMSAIRAEVQWFLPEFEARGQLVAMALLDESERRIQAERERYGLTSTTVTKRQYTGSERGPQWRDVSTTTYGIADVEASRGLAADAASLVAKHAEIMELRGEQLRLSAPRLDLLTGRGAAPPGTLPPETVATLASLAERIRERQRDYDIFRAAAEQKYPILATFGGEPGGAALAALAKGVSPDAAAVLEPVITEKLTNIATARLALKSGELPIWKLPVIVDLTRAHLSIETGSMHDRLVRDTAQQIEADERWVQAALSALGIAIALVGLLAAPFTGGSSFGVGLAAGASIAGGGLSAYLIYEEIQRYQLDAAASGTDFDKAKALSMADPSLFWLALEILSSGVDLVDALQAFRVLRAAVRSTAAARQAGDAAALSEELDTLTEWGNQFGDGLGDRIRARVEAGDLDDLVPIDRSRLTPEERELLEEIEASDQAAQLTTSGAAPVQMLSSSASGALRLASARERFDDFILAVWINKGDITRQRQIYSFYSSGRFDVKPSNVNPFRTTDSEAVLARIGALERGRPVGSLAAGQDGVTFYHYFRQGAAKKVRENTVPTATVKERIYISTKADNAMDVMDHVVRKIVDDPVSFPGVAEAKVTGPFEVTNRFDSIVIYLEDNAAVPAVLREIESYQLANPSHFDDYELPMTDPRLTGVSVAAEPAGGQSVGELYADMLYTALTESQRLGENFVQFESRVLQALLARGIDPSLPHRL